MLPAFDSGGRLRWRMEECKARGRGEICKSRAIHARIRPKFCIIFRSSDSSSSILSFFESKDGLKAGSRISLIKMTDDKVSSPFVEVLGSDGKAYRFAAGTKAGFAVDRLSRRLSESIVCIQARKEGDEPVDFGPDAQLINYGDGWSLCTVESESNSGPKSLPAKPPDTSGSQPFNIEYLDPSSLYPGGKLPRGRKPEFTLEYVGKVALCFVFMLLLGTILKSSLEQLPSWQSSQVFASNAGNEL